MNVPVWYLYASHPKGVALVALTREKNWRAIEAMCQLAAQEYDRNAVYGFNYDITTTPVVGRVLNDYRHMVNRAELLAKQGKVH